MAEIHQIPDAKQAEHLASEWIARLNADDVSAEDRNRFDAWRNAHPVNARAYEALRSTWEACTSARPFIHAVTFADSVSEASVSPPRHWRRVLVAAALAGVVATSGWIYFSRQAPQPTFSTTNSEHAKVALPDGSTMELNSNSLARMDYSTPSRVIHLDRGEAFFKVAHDTHRPFWVVAGNSWVRAVGTAFNVNVSPTAVEVTVGEGTVKVGAAEGATSVLTAGQQADLTGAATATRHLSSAELARFMAWRDDTLYFENQPLGDIVDELGRYSPQPLVVDKGLRSLPMGGTFPANAQGTEALLKMLEQGFGLTVRRDDGRIYIEPSPPRQSD